jgi:hypothetical protein
MSDLHVIIDQPLPLSQDYRALKDEGLAYIQTHSGNEWTNLNNVDPGVTILEQLCYALTELGYCNEFPVKDILTKRDGTLMVKEQFYLPEEILTTAPVTIADYGKCLIDGVSGVSNAVILAIKASEGCGNGTYQVYLQPDPSLQTTAEKEELCKAAYVYLNKWRNLGEMFLQPLCLINDPHTISGQIEINDETQLSGVLIQLQQQVQQYIFPQVKAVGYDTLQAAGMRTEEIFNGPLLQNGWIPTSFLGEKRDQLQLIELQQLIQNVPGVSKVTGLAFDLEPSTEEIHATTAQLLFIDWSASLSTGLSIYCKGRKLVTTTYLRTLSLSIPQSSDPDLVFGTAPDTRTTVPTGKFRDINSYYSIQNTFPEIYAVGADATIASATDFQIAQSRQLKGYLTLFDQILANQFSQLANLGTLFSFKNALSGTPSDQAYFYAVKDEYEKTYPVPYLAFSPTYFYQSLYGVPHIKPLLKDNGIYNFSIAAESEKELEYKSWMDYKRDPYNPYIKGLMGIMEDEPTGLLRRNNMLDHLLARHGESPLLINTILNGSSYSGESLKDQVIFKSLFLQNLGLLSYFRQKAYNYLGANKVLDRLTDVSMKFDREIMGGYTRDFIFNSEKIDRIEELTSSDFIHYSALELKLSLLFGLKVQYRDFIANHFDLEDSATNLKLAMWMIMERRGLIVIETGLLQPYSEIPTTTEQVILIFPAFIPQLNTEEFKNRLELYLQETMPVHVTYRCHFVSSSILEILIIAFADWHNGLIYPSDPVVNKPLVSNASSNLINIINQINIDSHAK